MTPRCLKCGEAHQTRTVPLIVLKPLTALTARLTAIWPVLKCPLFPKPHKGKQIKNNYTTVVDSIVRPNTSYAQEVTNPLKPNQPKISQQMAPRVNEAPAISRQIQSNRNFNNHLTPQILT
ncbi:hypothetical protein TNCV_4517861 [Trichonephila clavipes]|nr:hypothetical protein TNCV_4517861 [Trichonephila clavipes]